MTRSVEIPEAAVEAAAEGLRTQSAFEEPRILARAALTAALPYLAPAAKMDRREVMKTLLEFHGVTRIPAPSIAELQDLADSLMALASTQEPASEFLCLQSPDGRHSTVAALDGENEPLGYNHCGYCGTRLDW